jgi:hypothetical protein
VEQRKWGVPQNRRGPEVLGFVGEIEVEVEVGSEVEAGSEAELEAGAAAVAAGIEMGAGIADVVEGEQAAVAARATQSTGFDCERSQRA